MVKVTEAEEILLELAQDGEEKSDLVQPDQGVSGSSETGEQAAIWSLATLPCIRPPILDSGA